MDKKAKILDIAMNLNRIGNWAADDYELKQKRIKLFLDQTTDYIKSLKPSYFSLPFKKTFIRFVEEYDKLKTAEAQKLKDPLYWAEKMMTWGNILTHRASLIKN